MRIFCYFCWRNDRNLCHYSVYSIDYARSACDVSCNSCLHHIHIFSQATTFLVENTEKNFQHFVEFFAVTIRGPGRPTQFQTVFLFE